MDAQQIDVIHQLSSRESEKLIKPTEMISQTLSNCEQPLPS
jgi:hypothetical protein